MNNKGILLLFSRYINYELYSSGAISYEEYCDYMEKLGVSLE